MVNYKLDFYISDNFIFHKIENIFFLIFMEGIIVKKKRIKKKKIVMICFIILIFLYSLVIYIENRSDSLILKKIFGINKSKYQIIDVKNELSNFEYGGSYEIIISVKEDMEKFIEEVEKIILGGKR